MKIIKTIEAPEAIGPYVQGRVANGFLFISGQIALDPKTGQLQGTTIELQTEQVLKNIGAILEAAGTDSDNIVKTTCFLKNMEDFVTFNQVYQTFFAEELPARSAVGVASLPKDALLEIKVIACINA